MNLQVYYDKSSGKWVCERDGLVTPYTTEDEARAARDTSKGSADAREKSDREKTEYVAACIEAATAFHEAAQQLLNLEKMWNSRLYGVSLPNTVTDAQIAGSGRSANQVAALMNMAAQVRNLVGNKAVIAGDYQVTLDQMRKVNHG